MEEDHCNTENFSIIELIGKKHTLKIIKTIAENRRPMRFQELQTKLKINSRTLTDRLQELAEFHIIQRISYDEIPPRVEYSHTEATEDLKPILESLIKFEKQHVKKIEYQLVKH